MKTRRRNVFGLVSAAVVLLAFAAGPLGIFSASGAQLTQRGVQLSDARVGETARYRFFFMGKTTGAVGSVRLQICANDPFPETPCTAPSGFSMSGATLANQGGMTGFSINPASTANDVLLTRTATPGTTTPSFYEFTGVVNPDAAGPYYGRILTYPTADGSGAPVDAGGIALDIEMSDFMIETYVPPYLLFCIGNTITGQDCSTANGNYVDFGELTSGRTASGQTQVVAATNAKFGFTVAVQGTTMASGTNVIPALASPDVSRQGVGQFGLNLRANTTPSAGQDPQGLGLSAVIAPSYNQPNFFAFTSGDVLVKATNPDMQKYTVTYVINVAKGQSPGYYVSTLTYIALASF